MSKYYFGFWTKWAVNYLIIAKTVIRDETCSSFYRDFRVPLIVYMFMSMFICLCICICIYICICISLSLCISISISISISKWTCICICISLSISLSTSIWTFFHSIYIETLYDFACHLKTFMSIMISFTNISYPIWIPLQYIYIYLSFWYLK